MFVAFAIASILIIYLFYHYFLEPAEKTDLPGPKGWPLVGNLFQLDRKDVFYTYNRWADEYGDLYRFRLGRQECIMINDLKLIREAMAKEEFASKTNTMWMVESVEPVHGPIYAHGDMAKKLRKLVLLGFKTAGVGRAEVADMMRQHAKTFCQFLDEKVDTGSTLTWREVEKKAIACTSSVIHELLLGVEFQHSKRESFARGIEGIFEFGCSASGIVNYWPWLRFVIPGGLGYASYKSKYDKLIQYSEDQVAQLKARLDSSDNCLIAQLLRKRSSDGDADLTDAMLTQITTDLFIGGQDSTAAAIQWLLPILACRQDIQDRLYEETQKLHITDSAWICRDKVPYLTAYIWEQLRFTTEASALPHACDADTELNGKLIPKGTIINYNISYVSISEKNFRNPECIMPERFLDPKTGEVIGVDNVIPFGIGKRLCVGELLARCEIHEVFREIVENFRFTVPVGVPKPSLLPQKTRIILQPEDYELAVHRRG